MIRWELHVDRSTGTAWEHPLGHLIGPTRHDRFGPPLGGASRRFR